MNKISKYYLIKKQIASVISAEKALQRCIENGLVIYGKGGNLHFYKSQAWTDEIVADLHDTDKLSDLLVPTLSIDGILADSGADDMFHFLKDKVYDDTKELFRYLNIRNSYE